MFIASILLLLIIIIPILLWWIERVEIIRPVFYRNSDAIKKLGNLYSEFDLATIDGKGLEGAIYTPKEYVDTILYFGGQGEDSVGVVPKLAARFKNYQIITFNYREYGKSGGVLTEKRFCDDALFVYEWVKEFYGNVIVVGFSLGTHAATYVASKNRVQLLLLVAPFLSIEKLIYEKVKLPSKLIFYKFNNEKLIKKVASPTIIISSKGDKVVKPEHPTQLAKKSNNLRLHKELIGYNHNEIIFTDEVEQILNRYRG